MRLRSSRTGCWLNRVLYREFDQERCRARRTSFDLASQLNEVARAVLLTNPSMSFHQAWRSTSLAYKSDQASVASCLESVDHLGQLPKSKSEDHHHKCYLKCRCSRQKVLHHLYRYIHIHPVFTSKIRTQMRTSLVHTCRTLCLYKQRPETC